MGYLNAKELVNLGIPQLPRMVKNIIERARREMWSNRKRIGIGGGQEYCIESMPVDVQLSIKEKLAQKILAKPLCKKSIFCTKTNAIRFIYRLKFKKFKR